MKKEALDSSKSSFNKKMSA